MTSSLLPWLVNVTIGGSLAILLVLTFSPLLRRLLGARLSFALWAVVLLRLFVPGVLTFPVPWLPGSTSLSPSRWVASAHVAEGPAQSPPINLDLSAPVGPARPSISPATVGLSIWGLGTGIILAFAMVRSLRAGRLVRRSRDLSGDATLAPLLAELTPRRLGLRETAELRSPALCGIIRPVILLPSDWRVRLTPSELRFVLLHEIGHLERGDLLWRWAFYFAQAVHWFNPLVWLAFRFARRHQEMACDEWVVLRIDPSAAPAYGETLLRLVRRINGASPAFPVQAGMAETRSGLSSRLAHLRDIRRRGWSVFPFAILTALFGLALSGATSRGTPRSAATSSKSEPSPTSFVPAPSPLDAMPPSRTLPTQIQIQSKFAQISPEAATRIFGSPAETNGSGIRSVYENSQFQALLRQLDGQPGVDLLSAPTVTTKSGNRAVVTIVREFRYPTQFVPPLVTADFHAPATPSHFETRNLGVTLEVMPSVTADRHIDLVVTPEVTEFSGFINYGGQRKAAPDLTRDAIAEAGRQITDTANAINQPVFSVRRMTTSLRLEDRQTALLTVLNANESSMLTDVAAMREKVPGEPRSDSLLLVFITATLVDIDGKAASEGAAPLDQRLNRLPAPRLDPARNLPYGIPVPGKPGFVSSPYEPQRGYVDLRGFPSQTEVKDPYTGKIFLVP